MNTVLILALIHLVSVASPGPDFAMVTKNSLTASRRAGFLTATGITLGIAVHLTYSFLGIGVLVANSVVAFNIIKYLGAAYLIYIGLKSIFSKNKETDTNLSQKVDKTQVKNDAYYFRLGLITNLLNPKAAVYFVSLFSQFIKPDSSFIMNSVMAIMILTITFSWFTFVAYVLSNEIIKAKFTEFKSYIAKAFGILLVGLGLKIALEHK